MASSSQQEGATLMIMRRQPHGVLSNEGSVAAHIAAWQSDDSRPVSPSARSSYIHWSLGIWVTVEALFHAQALARQRSITAALLSSNTNTTSDEVHIQILDDGTESWIEDSPAPTQNNTAQSSSPKREREEVEPLLNRSRLTEAFLVIGAQLALTLSTVGSKTVAATSTSGNSSLSPNANLLLEFAMACNIVGFLGCLYGILLFGHKPGIGARILTGIGYAATVFGVLAVMCMQLLEHLMLWVTAVTCLASAPALAAAFLKRTDYPCLFSR